MYNKNKCNYVALTYLYLQYGFSKAFAPAG
jgi:hypothetical protein